jgi:hypothetical protein
MSKKKQWKPGEAVGAAKVYLVSFLSEKLKHLLSDEERADVLKSVTIEGNRFARFVDGKASAQDLAWIRGHEGDVVSARAILDAQELEASDAA